MASMAIAGLLIRCAREGQQAEVIAFPAATNTRAKTSRTHRRRAAPVVPLRPEGINRYSSRKP